MSDPYRGDSSTMTIKDKCNEVITRAQFEFGEQPANGSTYTAMARWIERELRNSYDVHALVGFFTSCEEPHKARCIIDILDHVKQITIKGEVRL